MFVDEYSRKVEFKELLRKTNNEKLNFGRIKCGEVGRHPVENV